MTHQKVELFAFKLTECINLTEYQLKEGCFFLENPVVPIPYTRRNHIQPRATTEIPGGLGEEVFPAIFKSPYHFYYYFHMFQDNGVSKLVYLCLHYVQ